MKADACGRIGIKSPIDDDAVQVQMGVEQRAKELGLTHEALYRTLRRLQANGTLSIDANRIARCRRNH